MKLTTSIAAIALAAGTLAANAAPATTKVPDTGTSVKLSAYTGLWYEIQRTGAPFEQKCQGGVTARYKAKDDGTLSVLNRCDAGGGKTQRIDGTAKVLNPSKNALNVMFPHQPKQTGANYLIEAVGPIKNGKYAWAVVRGSDNDAGKTGWILARQPQLDGDMLKKARAAAKQAGLNPSGMKKTQQPPDSYKPQAS